MNKLKTLFLSIIIGLAIGIVVFAFTNPPGNPPTGGGAVGVETNAPANSIYINSSGRTRMTGFQLGTSASAGYVLTTDASGVGTWQAVSALPSGASGQTLRHNGTTWVANSTIFNDGTNVGIGTTGPTSILHVVGTANDNIAQISSATDNTTVKLINTGTGGRTFHLTSSGGTSGYGQGKFVIADSAVGSRMVIDSSGNVGIGTTDPGTNRLKIAGGNLDLSGNNITGVTKISVNTIDPIFKINGQKYVTYVPDSIGQKVEVVGAAQLTNGEWSIDLAEQTDNSDLWLFYRIIQTETIIPFISSQSSASLYAFLEGSKLVVKLKDGDSQAKFSYRLIADRIDSQSNNYLLPETEANEVYIDVDSLK